MYYTTLRVAGDDRHVYYISYKRSGACKLIVSLLRRLERSILLAIHAGVIHRLTTVSDRARMNTKTAYVPMVSHLIQFDLIKRHDLHV